MSQNATTTSQNLTFIEYRKKLTFARSQTVFSVQIIHFDCHFRLTLQKIATFPSININPIATFFCKISHCAAYRRHRRCLSFVSCAFLAEFFAEMNLQSAGQPSRNTKLLVFYKTKVFLRTKKEQKLKKSCAGIFQIFQPLTNTNSYKFEASVCGTKSNIEPGTQNC